jgi:hypothetical protein
MTGQVAQKHKRRDGGSASLDVIDQSQCAIEV